MKNVYSVNAQSHLNLETVRATAGKLTGDEDVDVTSWPPGASSTTRIFFKVATAVTLGEEDQIV
jgi:hypothetical protein